MRDLLNLTKLINKKGQRGKSLLFDKDFDQGLEQKFFKLINSGKLSSDIEAAEILYDSNPDDPRYKILKSRVKRKIFNHLYFLNGHQKDNRDPEKARIECLKDIYLSQVLFSENEFDLSEKVLKKCHDLAEKHQLNEIMLLASKLELKIFGDKGNSGLLKKTFKRLNDVRRICDLEDKAEYLFYKGKQMIARGKKCSDKKQKQIKNILEELEDILNTIKTYAVFQRYYNLSIDFYKSTCEFESLLSFCDKVSELAVVKKSDITFFDLNDINYHRIYACYKMNRPFQDKTVIANLLEDRNFDDDKFNKYQKILFQKALQQKEFHLVEKTLEIIYTEENWQRLNKMQQLDWEINRAYYCLLSAKTFHNSIPDKGVTGVKTDVHIMPNGSGFHLAILNLIDRIKNREFEEARGLIENLVDPCSKSNSNFICRRIRSFRKLILILKKANFEYQSVKSRGRYLHKQLNKGMYCNNGMEDHEIIPFEKLWDLILLELQQMEKETQN